MKTILSILLSALLTCSCMAAPLIPVPSTGPVPVQATATFVWDANPEPDIAGYNLYFGTEPGKWDSKVAAGPNTQAEILFPDFGVYYVVATALNNSGLESKPSDELMAEVIWRGPSAPGEFRATGMNVAVQASYDLENWKTIATATNPFGMREFYRLALTKVN